MDDTFISLNDPEPAALLEPRRHSLFAIQCELADALLREQVLLMEEACRLLRVQTQEVIENKP